MASIQRRPNGRWRARYRDPAGRERARHFDRKVDAQRWLDEMTTDLVSGTWVDPNAGRVQLREYVETRWLPAQVHLGPNSKRLYGAHLRTHILPLLGDRQLSTLRRPDMKEFVGVLATRLAPTTTRPPSPYSARSCSPPSTTS